MKEKFEFYFQTLNHHQIEKTLGFYAEAFELHFTGSDFIIDKKGMKDVLGWDKAVKGSVTFENLKVDGDSVSGLFIEQNDFFRLNGIDELKSQNRFTFNESGLIIQQTYDMLPNQPSFQEKMQPAVEWAKKYKAEELQEIYPQGQIQFNQKMGEKWIKLLTEWKEAT